ncbi:hypothetical protein ACDY97_11500, partial [Rhizobium mongolense]
MSVASWSGSVLAWQRELDALKERLGPVFRRRELRLSSGAFLDGVLSGVGGAQDRLADGRAGWPGASLS